jgi:hypothetical protein
MSLAQLSTVHDRPILAGALRLTPESHVLTVRLPSGGLVWQRPTAVVVDQPGRASRRIPIVDLTRVAQLALLLGTVLCLMVISRQKES